MAVDQRALARFRRLAHRIRHRLKKRGDAGKRPRRVSLVGNPRRKLHHFAKHGSESLAVGGVEGFERNGRHADR